MQRWALHIVLLLVLSGTLTQAHAALTINAIDVPTRIGRGQTVPAVVSVTRASGSAPETVTITSPAELEIVAPMPASCSLAGAAGSPQTLTCGAVDPVGLGTSATFNFNVRGRILGGGNIAASNAGPPVSIASDSFSVVSGGDLSVGKTVTPSAVFINGQSPAFTLTPSISGDTLPAGSVITVTDQLPGSASEFTLASVSAPGYSCNSVAAANASRLLSCTATGPLSALGPITLQGRVTLAGAGGLRNNAAIAPDGVNYIDIQPGNDTAFVDFTINNGADPRPTGSFPAVVAVGSAQTLSINYVNDGPQSTTGGQVRVAVPAGFTIGTLPAGCVNSGPGTVNGVSGTVLTCTSGTVTSGGSRSFALPLTTPATPGGGNFGVEVVTGAGGALPGGLTDANTANNQVLVPFNVVAAFADLSISKSKTPGPLAAGAAIVNTISVTNAGVADAVYSGAAGSTPLRVVDTLRDEEEFVSASAGWTCTDLGAGSGGAGLRRIVCLRTLAGTLAAGSSLPLTLNTRVAASLLAPISLSNEACTGATALTLLGLTPADGPQPPDGNQISRTDCASAASVGTPIVAGQAQASVVKESSRDGVNWFDAEAAAPTVLASDNAIFWRITVTTPSVGTNALQRSIPTLRLNDALPAVLNVASPGAGIPGFVTPGVTVTTTVLAGSAGGGCPATLAAGSAALACSFSNVAPGSTLQLVVRAERPFEAGTFTNTALLSSPDVILTAATGGQLSDAAAVIVLGRADPAVTSKIVNPPNSGIGPRVGQVVTYTIVARNLGPNLVNGPFAVTDTLDPTRLLVLSASAVGSGNSPAMNCSFVAGTGVVTCATAGGSVGRYDFYTVSVQARLIKPATLPVTPPNTFTNTATVALDTAQNCEFLSTGGGSAACNDAASRSNNSGSAAIDIKNPLIDVVQKKQRVLPPGQNNFAVGDTLRYRFREQNNGPSRAEGIVVTDRINAPAGYTVTLLAVSQVNAAPAESGYALDTAKSGATVNCTQPAGNADVTCRLAAGAANFLDPGAEVNFELSFTLTGPAAVASIGNTAQVCADESAGFEASGSCVFTPSTTAGNNIAAVNDLILPRTDLSITKARITASPVALNQPVQYALTVQNLGNNDTAQMRIRDVLPPNFEWLGAGAFVPTAVPGGFAGLTVSGIACNASPASITAAGQQQTVSCVLDGNFPSSVDPGNTVLVTLFARPKAGFFTGPYLTDRPNTATVSPGLDSITGQPTSIDINPANDSASATVQVQTASLAGTVFEDRDRSGANGGVPQAAASEPRIAGVAVRLQGTDAFGNAIDLGTTTNSAGNYSFANLPPAGAGGYTLTQTQPSGFVNGPVAPPTSGAGSPSIAGSIYAAGALAGNSSYSGIALTLGAAGTNFNFPEVRQISLGGFVYIDINGDGVRNAGTDTAIAGATVRLLAAATGTVLATTTTDSAGAYSFSALDPLVAYTLEQPLPSAPAGLANGPVNPGLIGGVACAAGCTAQPNTPVAGTDRIAAIDLGAGIDGTAFNFGELQTSFVSGLVWIDSNRNATLDAGETGRLPGVTLRLVQGADCATGTTLQTTSTAADGRYRFDDVRAFQNYLVCQTQPAGYGTGSGNGAPGNVATVANLGAGGSADNNFGETLASLAGSVYQDTGNGLPAQFDNGVRDAGEPGIAGVTVTLSGTDALNNPVNLSTTTDANGNYAFDGLLAAGPAGYTLSEGSIPPAAGTFQDGRDTAGTAGGSNAVNDVLSGIRLAAGQQANGYLFGELRNDSISGTVYIDRDRNGLLDPTPTDGRIPGVTVRLVQGADCATGTTLQTTLTDSNGNYGFANVSAGGNYLLCQTQPAGYANSAENPGAAATTPGVNTIRVSSLPANGSAGNHFGERLGSLAGAVYVDFSPTTHANSNNGQRDAGEAGIAGVTVTLSGRDLSGNAVSRSTVTDSSGNYSFADLLQSDGSGYALSEGAIPAAAGSFNDGRDSAGTAGGSTAVNDVVSAIVLGAGVQAGGYDFGELPPGDISGRVYADGNNNGLVDGGEPGLGGVTIVLTGTDDLGNPVTLSTTTAPDGSYSFAGLRPGTYTVTEPTQPAGTLNGLTTPGSLGGTATPPTTAVSAISGIVLGAGGRATGNNFGELGNSPDVRVSKSLVNTPFTVGYPGSYRISVRNTGEVATVGPYTVSDRLPAGLTLAATPTGTGWVCAGAAGASSFSCTSSSVIAAAATGADTLTASVDVAATAVANSPVNNAVRVEGGGEISVRGPSAAERDAFDNNPGALPLCTPAIEHNACRTPTPVQQAAAISGTVWYDTGSLPRLLDAGDRRLAGWQVEIVDTASGAIVGRATTGADGRYLVRDLLPGVPLAVRFRDPASGVVFGYPVNGETAPGSSGAACSASPGVGSGASSCVGSGAMPALSVVLSPGQELPQQSLPVDPSGVVYDSGSRQPVPGSVVTLSPVGVCVGWNPATGLVGATLGGYTVNGDNVAMTVGVDGFYQFLFAPAAPASCTWRLVVTPPAAYSFESRAIFPAAGPLAPPGRRVRCSRCSRRPRHPPRHRVQRRPTS